MQLEADPDHAAATERLDMIGMQSAGPGAGIDLGLDGGDVKLGQPDPLAPADLDLAQREILGFASMRLTPRL
jgi:hypothetical protein